LDFYSENQNKINNLNNNIENKLKYIDNQIYKLYNLSSEEINVIENAK